MAQNYNILEKVIVGIYSRVFSDSNISLKKYSRKIYILSVLLLVFNVVAMWLFSQFNNQIQGAFEVTSDELENLADNFNLTLNFLEVGLGFSGAFLDFTPNENKLAAV